MTALAILQTIGGFLLLFLGGELLLRGAIGLARILGLPPLLIGLSVVAAATSMPELVVTLTAGLSEVPDLGVGNIVGSNIANILLILGAAAVVRPIVTHPRVVLRDAGAVLIATALFIGFGLIGPLGRIHGAVMLALLGFYLWFGYWSEMRARDARAGAGAGLGENLTGFGRAPTTTAAALGLVAAGTVGLVVGSDLLVAGAVEIARAAGLSETVIGLTLIAVGTSLPELATAIVAARHGHGDVALGNALGSNIFNLLLVLGVFALATPLRLAPEVLRFDIWVMAGVTVAVIPIMLSGWRISRREGVLFLGLYAAYIWVQFAPATGAG
ncbi:MAG: calcium/sodium antiporter [Proteobacteria bacterium]|nr:calcium/sodium antiporter [Pseudomonadota bacterium]